MDLQSIIGMTTSALDKDRDGQLEAHEVMAALRPLLGSMQPQGSAGGLDLSSLIKSMQQDGLGAIAQSWLGDGANAPISGEQLQSLLGQDKIDAFAQTLGMDSGKALNRLQDLLPGLIDTSSRGGELLQGMGGTANGDTLGNMIGGLVGGLFKR